MDECRTTILTNILFSTDVTNFSQSFLAKIARLSEKKEHSEIKASIGHLSLFIKSQILDPSIPSRADLACIALDKYAEVFKFVDMEAVNLIKETYLKVQPIENTDLNSACQKFLKACDHLPVVNAEIKIRTPQLAVKIEEISTEQIAIENSKK